LKTKVLHVIPDLRLGGAEKLLVDLIKFRNRSEFEIAVCSLYGMQGTLLEEELDKLNIKVFYLNKKLGFDPKIIVEFYNILKIFKPDIIHTHLYVLKYVYIPFLISNASYIVHTIHSDPKYEVNSLGKKIHKIIFKDKRIIPVSISKIIRNSLIDIYGQINSPVIYNGVDIEKYKTYDKSVVDRLLNELEIKDDEKVILHVGRFVEAKNHFLLIDLFQRILLSNNKVKLVLLGDGPLRKEIFNYSNSKGLNKNVFFLGFREDVNNILQIADLLVFTSNWEGIPLAVLEALSAGIPVVSTNVGGMSEIIEHGKNGYLTDKGDIDSLYNYCINILNDPDLKEQLSSNAIELSKQFDIRTMTLNYESLYKNLLKRS
jgi:glycosyltransferase involved in cell wall biosynthesis